MSAWEKYEENLVGNLLTMRIKREFGVHCKSVFSAPAYCSVAEVCNQLLHGFLEDINDSSLEHNLNIFMLTHSCFLSLFLDRI